MHSRKSRAKLLVGYDGLPVLGLVPASSRVGRPPVLGLGRGPHNTGDKHLRPRARRGTH